MRNLNILFATSVCIVFGSIPLAAQTISDPAKVLPADALIASTSAKNDRYRIGFQDVLNIQVFRHPDLNQTVPVSPNGTIILFRLDRPVIAVCKTERELATEIAGAYKEKFIRDPQVNVVVAEQKSQSVAVIGAVEKPGNFYVNRRIHLLEMLAMAGGPNKEAGTRLLIARTGSTSNCKESGDPADSDQVQVVGFKVRDIQEGKQTFWMQPGDVVSVLDADIIYVYGNVNKQGSYKVREPITLTQAIVSAEGLKPAANKSKVRILRQRQGSVDREELVFDLNQIDKGKIKDPYLEPNDILAVSEDRAKSILLGLANSIKSSVPNVIYKFPIP
ncbi:MAG: SLBB domain-containing protein [Pyrinomonadaceae bacterium]